MGFLSRKKPKPAPVEIQEERQIVDDLQEMEAAVPERGVEELRAQDEDARGGGPVSDSGLPPEGESSESSPPAPEAAGVEPVIPAVEEESALNAQTEDEEEGDARMKAIDWIAPTRLDFLQEREAAAEE